MASNFSSLRKSKAAALDALNKKLKEETKQGADERFWKLTVDPKNKRGYARLRFLPAPPNEEAMWVRLFTHAFQREKGKGSWFIDNCPTTLGNERTCPVCKDNNRLWNTGDKDNQNIVRDRKRQQKYISNILVIEDSSHPENNGKVFLFKYGPKIFEKIQEAISPKFPDQSPINPFDLWEGADFKLKSHEQGDFLSYDKSEFTDPIELYPGDDAKKEAVWNTQYSLQEFVAPDKFKSYDDLAKRFNKVLNGEEAPATAQDAIKSQEATVTDAESLADAIDRSANEKLPRKPRKTAAPKVDATAVTEATLDDEDDIRKFFDAVLD